MQNYIENFRKVSYLKDKMKIEDIRQVTGLSERLISEYLDLYAEYPDSDRLTELEIPGSKKMEDI
ncbi:MAG: DUF1670 domain-containing protein [Theionarchaea archaeon]|nr:DUF1670 domain-containing protein [Theionarchaea archaeon]